MRRRDLVGQLGGAAALWPLTARGQQKAMPLVGFLHSGSAFGREAYAVKFREGLADGGYIEGNNVAVEYRWAEDKYERLPELGSDFVQRQANVIVAATLPAALATKKATSTIPIVFWVGDDPMRLGLVASFSRPGGNATGITMFSAGLLAKRLQLLREFVPVSRIGVLLNSKNPNIQTQSRELEQAAGSFRERFEVVQAGTENETEAAFASLAQRDVGGLVIGADPVFVSLMRQIVALSARYKVATIYERREFVDAGGLISYGADQIGSFREVGVYAGRILNGERPADLPVQQPTKFELIVNLNTAKALGLTCRNYCWHEPTRSSNEDRATMTGRARLPGGEPRKASQRNVRPAAPKTIRLAPTWRTGDQIRWKGRLGVFRRDRGDGEHVEVVIGERVYRVLLKELG